MATLLLKLLVPAGYMISSDHGRIGITLCSGMAPRSVTMFPAMPMPMPGMHGAMADHDGPDDHGRPDMPCAFAGLSAAMTGPVDPIQIAALIAFILAVGLVSTALPAPCRRVYLRPPLRGPPARL